MKKPKFEPFHLRFPLNISSLIFGGSQDDFPDKNFLIKFAAFLFFGILWHFVDYDYQKIVIPFLFLGLTAAFFIDLISLIFRPKESRPGVIAKENEFSVRRLILRRSFIKSLPQLKIKEVCIKADTVKFAEIRLSEAVLTDPDGQETLLDFEINDPVLHTKIADKLEEWLTFHGINYRLSGLAAGRQIGRKP